MKNKTILKILFYFFILSVIWIIVSDNLNYIYVPDAKSNLLFQTLKGIFYVILSCTFIFYLLKRFVTKDINELQEKNVQRLNKVKTELKSKEDLNNELEKYQENLNAIIESELQGFILMDKNSKVILFNKSAEINFENFSQIKLQEGLIVKDVLEGELKTRFINNINKALAGENVSSEVNLPYDNKDWWINFRYSPAKNRNNEIFGIIFSAMDITDRMNTLKELKNTVEIYSDLIKATPDAVAIIREDFSVEYISPAALEILNIKNAESAINQNILSWFEENEIEKIKSSVELIIKNKTHTKGKVYRMKKEDGSLFYGEFNSSPIEDLNGNVNSFITTFRDITERKIAEEKLKKYSEELKELNASKDKFFSIVAHDLRNPLQGLLGFSSLLIDNFSDLTYEEIKEYVGFINQSAKKMHNLTNNLLQWSRIKTGNIEFTPRNLNLSSNIKSNIELLKPGFLKKNIEINFYSDDNCTVLADKNMLDSIFQNLLSNAIKFSYPNSNVEISIDKNIADFLQVSIKDYGIGIKKDNFEKIFSIESNFSTNGTSDEEGTGLGLILSKELVEKQGGKIDFESKQNAGSTFRFTLPVGNSC